MIYTPDRWVVVRLDIGETLYKVLGGWHGGYLGSDSWRLNSGCTGVKEDGDFLEFTGWSGSVYRVHKNAYGMSVLMASTVAQLEDYAKENGREVEVMPEDTDWLALTYE